MPIDPWGGKLEMQVDKDDVVDLLRSRGEHDKAANVECALPRQVVTEADAGLLHQFDVNVSDIAAPESVDGENPVTGAGA
jgi:hypothetical protein